MGYNLKDSKKVFDPLPAGRYTLKIESTKVEPHQKESTTGDRIEITFRIVDGQYANRKVWDNLYLPWVPWKARTILEAAGKINLSESADVGAEDIASALLGAEVSAYLESEKVGTTVRTNVSEYKPVTDALPEIMR